MWREERGAEKLKTWEYREGWRNTSNDAGMGFGREEFEDRTRDGFWYNTVQG
jgi:hypothetical protein